MVVVTKDDGDQQKIIQKAKHDYQQALQILRHDGRIPPVLTCSSTTKTGLPEIYSHIESYFIDQKEFILEKRNKQGLDWMWQLIQDGLKDVFKEEIGQDEIHEFESRILSNKMTAHEVATTLLKRLKK
jgi:putative protein kinase ArgK-like GTPase of G3E family